VDNDAGCISFVRKSLETLGGMARSSIIRADVVSLDLSLLPRPDIVFVDPPYRSAETYGWAFSTGWGGIVRDGGIVMVEAPAAMADAEGWTRRRYGDTSLFWKWFVA
jgi:16S rRNA G966 N2-methylase RsmD